MSQTREENSKISEEILLLKGNCWLKWSNLDIYNVFFTYRRSCYVPKIPFWDWEVSGAMGEIFLVSCDCAIVTTNVLLGQWEIFNILKKIQAKLKRIFKPIWRISMAIYKYMWCFIYSFCSRIGPCRARYPILMHNGSTGRSEIECKPNLKNIHTYLKIIQRVFGVLEQTFTSSCRSSIGCFHARDVILAMK
jgi:hypothetical protein